jgi:8-oxo-dGTP diphosphatase
MQFRIGIGVIIWKSGKVLIGKRTGSHGDNTWSFPGGHLEENETPAATGRREVGEETGLEVGELSPAGFTFDHFEENGRDYLTLFYSCDWVNGTPAILEQDKCLEWRWEAPDQLPGPLFKPVASLMRQGGIRPPVGRT